MSRRPTVVLPFLLCGALLAAPQESEAAGGPDVQDGNAKPYVLVQQYGEVGVPGGFLVTYNRKGGVVTSVKMLGEPARPEVRSKPREEWTLDDAYTVVEPVQQGLFSFALWEPNRDATKLVANPYRNAWEAEESPDGITFTLTDSETGLTLTRSYRWDADWRGLEMALSLSAAEDRAGDAMPKAGDAIALVMRGPTLVNPHEEHFFRNPAFGIGQMDAPDGSTQVEVVHASGKPLEDPSRVAWTEGGYAIDYAGTTNRFFGGFLVPNDDATRAGLQSCSIEAWPKPRKDSPPLVNHDVYSVPVARYALRLPVPAAGATSTLRFQFFLGPKSGSLFAEPRYARFHAVYDTDLTPPCFCYVPGTREIGAALLWILRQFYAVFGNYGVAIALLTLMVRSAMVPLNFRMQKSMRAYGAKMSVLKPELDALRKRYEKDPRRMQQEMAAFQRKHKLFPPLGGCLPMFLTMPVFWGLFTALRVAYELRDQPFVGWIQDLSQPDQAVYMGLSFAPYLNVLPLLWIAMMFAMQMTTPLPTDPQQRQVAKMMRFFPLVFGVMLYGYASGLMVYMVVGTTFSLIESRITRRILGPPTAEGGMTMPTF